MLSGWMSHACRSPPAGADRRGHRGPGNSFAWAVDPEEAGRSDMRPKRRQTSVAQYENGRRPSSCFFSMGAAGATAGFADGTEAE